MQHQPYEKVVQPESPSFIDKVKDFPVSNPYKYIFENSPHGFAFCRIVKKTSVPVDIEFIKFNQEFRKIFGLPEEVKQKASGIFSRVGLGLPEVLDLFKVVSETGIPRNRAFFNDALKIWFRITVIKVKKGVFLTTVDDISKEKRAEEELKKYEIRFKTITENAFEGIVVADFSGKYVFVNPAFCDMVKYSQAELLNMTVYEIGVSEEKPFLFEVARYYSSGKTKNQKLRCKDNSVIYVDINAKAIKIDNEDFILGMVTEVTGQVLMEKQLALVREKAEESNRLKSAFLHNLSHEIRTPLNAICGLSDLISQPGQTDSQRNELSGYIRESSKSLLSAVNNILTISILETNQLKLSFRMVCINTLLNDLLKTSEPQAAARNLNISLKKGLSNRQSEINTDGGKVTEILNNLISNALKFTEKGGVEFGYVLKNSWLEFYVKDSGIGIDPEVHHLIFERFAQSDGNVRARYRGLGLGLAIAKDLAEHLGGNIRFESRSGEGSVFYFSLPYNPEN